MSRDMLCDTFGQFPCGCRLYDGPGSDAASTSTNGLSPCPLHAAAPDLLAALAGVTRIVEAFSYTTQLGKTQTARLDAARAAIRKARGEGAMTTREAIETALRERIIEPLEDA